MKRLFRSHFFSLLSCVFLCHAIPAAAQTAAPPRLQPLPATIQAPEAEEGEGNKRSPARSRKASPRKTEIQTCTPDVKKIAPDECLSPGGVVTVRGSCFGDGPGSYGLAVRTGRGTIHKLEHGEWSDGRITLTLPPLSGLVPGAGALLGVVRSSSSEWIDGEPITVCAAPSRRAAAPRATKLTPQAGKVPGATLKKSVTGRSTESRTMTKDGPGLGGVPSSPPQGGAIGQKLYNNDPPIPPKVTVTQPPAGAHLREGETHLIQWEYQGLPENTCVRLELYRGKPFRDVITESVCGTSSNWYVPGAPYGVLYNVRAEVVGTNVADHSELFTMSRRIPDASIEIPRIQPSAPRAGKSVTFRARIYNRGGEVPMQNSATLDVTGPNGYHETYTYAFPLLLPDDPSSLFIVSESYTVPAPGAYYNMLTAHFSGPFGAPLPPVTATVPFYAEGMPDLVACLHDPWHVSTGVTKTIPLYIKNIGTAASGETMAAFYVQGKGIVHRTVPPLDPGESVQLPYQNKWWVAGSKNMIAVVDPNDIVDELHENNNRRCGTLKKQHGKVYNPYDFPTCSDAAPCTTVMPAGN